jgi:hypothetical protein
MMTALTRRQALVGAAATVAAAALPAAAEAAPAKAWTITGITWDGRRPSVETVVWWEDRLNGLLWKRVRDDWACLGPILDPVKSLFVFCSGAQVETYVAQEHPPAWELVAPENLTYEIETSED